MELTNLENSIPGFGNKSVQDTGLDNYRIKYFKADLDDPSAVMELERLETEGLKAESIVLLNKATFSFQASFFVVLTYGEKKS